MAVRKQVERDFAKVLFVNDNVTQKEIALRLNITEKTIGNWVKDGDWAKIKKSILVTKNSQLSMLYDQLDFVNTDIITRDYKIATTKEADVISKLTSAIKKLETETNIGETIEVAKQLIQFIHRQDIQFSQQLTRYCDAFIQQKMK